MKLESAPHKEFINIAIDISLAILFAELIKLYLSFVVNFPSYLKTGTCKKLKGNFETQTNIMCLIIIHKVNTKNFKGLFVRTVNFKPRTI